MVLACLILDGMGMRQAKKGIELKPATTHPLKNFIIEWDAIALEDVYVC